MQDFYQFQFLFQPVNLSELFMIYKTSLQYTSQQHVF